MRTLFLGLLVSAVNGFTQDTRICHAGVQPNQDRDEATESEPSRTDCSLGHVCGNPGVPVDDGRSVKRSAIMSALGLLILGWLVLSRGFILQLIGVIAALIVLTAFWFGRTRE